MTDYMVDLNALDKDGEVECPYRFRMGHQVSRVVSAEIVIDLYL